MEKLPAFKAYDVRGLVPDQLNPTLAYHLGRGLAATQPQATGAVVGMDSRTTSPALLAALAAGLAAGGVAVRSLGLCGTEEVYHAAGAGHADLGIMVTASHNPIGYNGFKFVKRGGQPFHPATDLAALEEYVRNHRHQPAPPAPAAVPPAHYRDDYVAHLLGFITPQRIPAQTIVINAGNGAAGPTADAILAHLPQLTVVRLHHGPDGTFPNGIPNPLLPGNRAATAQAVIRHGAALGIAWDGDFDRCFLYDGQGRFVSNYYLSGLLAQAMLQRYPGSAIVHDPRLFWDTAATITRHGGRPVVARVGHGYIKPEMRRHNAPFAGEISGHFYFRDFYSCDSGMLPWLLVLDFLAATGQSLAAAIAERAAATPASDELNFHTPTPAPTFLTSLQPHLAALGQLSFEDGITTTGAGWRANLRASSNESLLRLNVEARSPATLESWLARLRRLLATHGATPAA